MKCLLLIAVVANIYLLAAAATEDDILMLLFTRENKGNFQKVRIRLNDANALKNSKFNGGKPTKFLVHGWFGGFNSLFGTWVKHCKDALLDAEDVNVFIVDWGKLARSPLYVGPARNTRFVGEKVARFAEFLEKSGGADRKRMHFIGHSLGGQVVGFVGKNLNPKPERVTGLDTAEIGFDANSNDDFLDQSDGDFVDEIHTLVSQKPKGHADFYPNGGADPIPLKVYEHMLASLYFIKSIQRKCTYNGYSCGDYNAYKSGCRSGDGNHMGYWAFKPARPTKYYLDANTRPGC